MYKILLTGSSGFIGSNILNSFSEKYKFYVIVRKKIPKKKLIKKNIKFIYFKTYESLNSKLKKIKVDIVIHCATHYTKTHRFSDIKKFCNSNLLFGNIILENLNSMKVRKFINFSTVWEDGNAQKNNTLNLYAAYKKSFSVILNFYKKDFKKVKFYELMISDTFGKNDQRKKIINTLKINYRKKKTTNIISKNLYINLLNILDIVSAINLILRKLIIPKKYLLKNKVDTKIFDLIKLFNKNNEKPLKVKWHSNRLIKYKIYPYDKLKGWKPNYSNIQDIINYIKF
ncbi:NAD(P)-dependent oxidoreductase [bacterium]|nr:NAD(P)-dependent oxidoreductase [bacterium]